MDRRAGGLAGSVLGTIGLVAATAGLDGLIDPQSVRDGQYPVVLLLFTVPFGVFLGAITGSALALVWRVPRAAGWINVIGGGFVLLVAVGMSSLPGGTPSVSLENLSILGLPSLWAIALLL